mgnify:CR=1 FL=1
MKTGLSRRCPARWDARKGKERRLGKKKNLVILGVIAVLIVVLLVKPAGLLGKYVPEKV